jgi:hypothetical protein
LMSPDMPHPKEAKTADIHRPNNGQDGRHQVPTEVWLDSRSADFPKKAGPHLSSAFPFEISFKELIVCYGFLHPMMKPFGADVALSNQGLRGKIVRL